MRRSDFPGHIFLDPSPHLCGSDIPRDLLRPIPGRHCLKRVGGIDFGFNNFGAVWATLDEDGNLWITGERFGSGPLEDHMQYLPKEGVTWYADPSSPGSINTMTFHGFTVGKGKNDVLAGINKIKSRLHYKKIFVYEERCPNLLREADSYHYKPGTEEEKNSKEGVVKKDDHCLDALRYMITRVDEGGLSKFIRNLVNPDPKPKNGGNSGTPPAAVKGKPRNSIRQSWNDPDVWTTIIIPTNRDY